MKKACRTPPFYDLSRGCWFLSSSAGCRSRLSLYAARCRCLLAAGAALRGGERGALVQIVTW